MANVPTRMGSFEWALQRVWADRIFAARRERGASQQMLADLLGVTQPIIAKWEASNYLPRLPVMLRTARVLNIDEGRLVPLGVPLPEGELLVPVTSRDRPAAPRPRRSVG
jgi:transcriptional regulator with XRE-family HTH domain